MCQTDKMEIVHSLVMCDRRQKPARYSQQRGHKFWAVQSVLTNILGMSMVHGLGLMGPHDVDQTSEEKQAPNL